MPWVPFDDDPDPDPDPDAGTDMDDPSLAASCPPGVGMTLLRSVSIVRKRSEYFDSMVSSRASKTSTSDVGFLRLEAGVFPSRKVHSMSPAYRHGPHVGLP